MTTTAIAATAGTPPARSAASTYPAVTALQTLAADCRAILGPGTKIGYAADWSEYFGHQPGDGTGDIYFHLDPLWADANINFIGVDNYLPVSDWRDGAGHLDASGGWSGIHDPAYLQSNIEGGEYFDWFYASEADRAAQVRTPIADTAHGDDGGDLMSGGLDDDSLLGGDGNAPVGLRL